MSCKNLGCLFFLQLFGFILAPNLSHAKIQHSSLQKTSADFDEYIAQYASPEIFMHNEEALMARLKLLDQLPAGAEAKIMTFVYENGESTRLLAAHMCLAAKRGVKVQLMPDSKTGSRPGVLDPFNGSLHYQYNEEMYQILTNCGVEVRIHNFIPDDEFQVLVTKPLVIPMLPHKTTSATLGYLSERLSNIWALENMRDDFNDILDEHFQTITSKAKEDVTRLKDIFKSILRSTIFEYLRAEGSQEKVETLQTALEKIRDLALNQTVLNDLDAERTKVFLNTLVKKIQRHPRLGPFYNGIRVFNRLNHRKLFWVSNAGKSCMFVGGRNLGDHYLTWNRHHDDPAFMDADVLVCSHHVNPQEKIIFAKAQNSFEQLWTNSDTEDPLELKPKIYIYKKDYNYEFNFVRLNDQTVEGWGNPLWIFMPQAVSEHGLEHSVPIRWRVSKNTNYVELSTHDRLIPEPTLWSDSQKVSGASIDGAFRWDFLTTTWMRPKDRVRHQMYQAIEREKELIYIETAYSEMSTGFRMKIEQALQRGVRVELVTNSIFVSDAGSKAIRLVMARWTRAMLEKYPTLFNVKFANIGFGHMIHFKGASFKCQVEPKSGGKTSVYRWNLIGSHNFHGRSGYTDKEHAITWRQLPAQTCAQKYNVSASQEKDLKDHRDQFYQDIAKTVDSAHAPLKTYYTFQEEIADAITTGKLSPGRLKLAQWAMFVLYEHDFKDGAYVLRLNAKGRGVLRAHDAFIQFLETLSESSAGDLVGTLL